MLKIKDNVDLKELEKFGFKELFNYYYIEQYYCDSDCITVNKINRHIILCIYYDPVEDILFDLIKANLVEKVDG